MKQFIVVLFINYVLYSTQTIIVLFSTPVYTCFYFIFLLNNITLSLYSAVYLTDPELMVIEVSTFI